MKQNIILLIAGVLLLAWGIVRTIRTWPRKPKIIGAYYVLRAYPEGLPSEVYTSTDGEHWERVPPVVIKAPKP